MEIIVGKSAGFCYGVKNAVESATEELKKTNNKLYFLGEIVHNSQVIDELKKEGAIFIDDIKDAKEKVVIRAHGISKEINENAKSRGIEIKDYTCPNVLKIHRIAEEYANKGYYILLFGSSKHPENVGTISYCGDKYFVIEEEEDLYNAIDLLNKWNIKDVFVISQTTFSLEKFCIFQDILKEELNKNTNLVIENTICRATEVRQQETEKMAKEVDCMIIIGGKKSSNTQKLYEIAEDNCKLAICIETVEELKNIDFSLMNKIGVMAGASTPQSSIDEVVNFLKDKYQKSSAHS